MWITIISDNFKDLLDTLKNKPWVVIVLSLMFLSGFFINRWVVSQDSSVEDLKARDKEISIIQEQLYEYKYESMYYKKLYEKTVIENDSLFRRANKLIRKINE